MDSNFSETTMELESVTEATSPVEDGANDGVYKPSFGNKVKTVFKDQWFLLLCTVPLIVYLLIFSYYPLTTWRWMFYDYQVGYEGMNFMQQYVGMLQFRFFFNNEFWQIMGNTLLLSVMSLIASTIASIGFAVFLNELPNGGFKKFVQTVSYLPHFVSWAVVANIYKALLGRTGNINDIMQLLNITSEPIIFLNKANMYKGLVTAFSVWKETGWSAIIYLSAITGINSELYEAASVDGAGRFGCMWHVTIAGISSTIIIITIMNIGWLLGAGYDQCLMLAKGNIEVMPKAKVLSYLSYEKLMSQNYSYGIVAGAFQSIVSVILLVSVNTLSKKLEGASIL